MALLRRRHRVQRRNVWRGFVRVVNSVPPAETRAGTSLRCPYQPLQRGETRKPYFSCASRKERTPASAVTPWYGSLAMRRFPSRSR